MTSFENLIVWWTTLYISYISNMLFSSQKRCCWTLFSVMWLNDTPQNLRWDKFDAILDGRPQIPTSGPPKMACSTCIGAREALVIRIMLM